MAFVRNSSSSYSNSLEWTPDESYDMGPCPCCLEESRFILMDHRWTVSDETTCDAVSADSDEIHHCGSFLMEGIGCFTGEFPRTSTPSPEDLECDSEDERDTSRSPRSCVPGAMLRKKLALITRWFKVKKLIQKVLSGLYSSSEAITSGNCDLSA